MKKNVRLTIKQLTNANKEYERNQPNFCPKTPDFWCPISPQVAWHKGLVYKECPVSDDQQNMGRCADCHLKSKGVFKQIKKEERRRKRPYKRKKK